MNIEAQIKNLVAQAKSTDNFTIGDLAMTILNRLPQDTQIRITTKGVRVTHSRYIDRLKSPSEIDQALARRETYVYAS